MTTIDTHAGASAGAAQTNAVVRAATWIFSSDHKKIGRLMVGEGIVATVAAAVIGALLGLERMSAGHSIFAEGATPQLVSLFQYLLVFGVLAPFTIGLAVAVAPLQVGSRSLSFPRLAVFGRCAWTFGTILVIVSAIGNGGPAGGTTDLVDLYLLAVVLSSAGLVAVAVSVATTILTSRAPGMTTDLLPSFSWGSLVGTVATALSLPVLVGTTIYLYVDHTYAKAAFGGNSDISKWMHSGFTQPATYVFAAIAAAIVAEIAPVAAGARQPLRGAVYAGLGLISTGLLGAVTQSQHVLNTDGALADKVKSAVPFLLFNALPVLGLLVVLGTAVLVLKEGSLKVGAALAFALLGNGMILLGMLGTLIQNISATGLSGTSLEEGATTFVVYGAVLAGVGGLLHWAPKLWGVLIEDTISLPVLGLAVVGTVLAGLGNFIAGFAGQPVEAVDGFTYDGPRGLWNILVAGGHVLVAVSLVAVALGIFTAVKGGANASDDPWNGHTLEWATTSPAPRDNFATVATVGSAEPVLDAKPNSEVSA